MKIIVKKNKNRASSQIVVCCLDWGKSLGEKCFFFGFKYQHLKRKMF